MLLGPLGLPLTAKRCEHLTAFSIARSIAKTTVPALTIHGRHAPYGGGRESDVVIKD
jgi:hypothetical protein